MNYDDIMESIEEHLQEAFSSKSKMTLAKGKTGIRYAVVTTDVTKGLGEEFWFNLDPFDGDAVCPRLRFAARILDTGKFYTYKDDKFGAMERPKVKAEEWWRRLASKDITYINKQFRDWLASSAGRSFVERNKLDGCLCVKNCLDSKH